jgi:ribonuclease P protein component
MIISKRTTPTAVKRNMIKRIIREAFRRSALSQRHFDVVVLLRGPVNLLDRPDIHLHINRLFGQLVDKEPR